MAHPDENLIPHYGSFLCNKLIYINTSRSGNSIMVALSACLPKVLRSGPHITESPATARRALSNIVFESMRLSWWADGNHHWTMGQNHDPKLLITPENWNILALKRPTNFTNWQITPYLFPISYSSEEDGEGEESEGDSDDDGGEEEP